MFLQNSMLLLSLIMYYELLIFIIVLFLKLVEWFKYKTTVLKKMDYYLAVSNVLFFVLIYFDLFKFRTIIFD